MSQPKNKYAEAIKYREDILKRFATNPPSEWSEEYLQKNIDCVQEQIDHFKEIG